MKMDVISPEGTVILLAGKASRVRALAVSESENTVLLYFHHRRSGYSRSAKSTRRFDTRALSASS
jgi:hypothetical protein